MSYDLALAGADYPDWTEARPRRTVLICSHMRSGSTLLAEALYRAGGLGCPLEYFHAGARPALAERWGAPDLDSYAAAVVRHRTDPTGTLGVKLFWRDVEELRAERGTDVLGELFPNPTWVLLTREDRLRQAISQLTARESGVWRRIPGVDHRSPRALPEYSFEEIASHLALVTQCQERWESFFREAGIEPLRVTYERLLDDYEGTVRTLLRALGREGPVEPPRMRRHQWEHTEGFVRRFLEEARRRRPGSPADPGALPEGARVARHPRALAQEEILLNAATGAYFGLDPVGREVWRALDRPGTVDEVGARLEERFEGVRRPDVARLLGELAAEGLVEVTPPGAAAETAPARP